MNTWLISWFVRIDQELIIGNNPFNLWESSNIDTDDPWVRSDAKPHWPQVKESMGGKACDSPNGSEFREALAIINPFRKNG